MKLDAVLAIAAPFLATDKKPEELKAAILAADKKAKDTAYDRKAMDERESAEDECAEAMDSRAAAADAAEEEEDDKKAKDRKTARDARGGARDESEEKEEKAATDRKTARDARKGARDARKTARDTRKGARGKRAKDSSNLDPEGTNDNELEQAEPGTPSKGGKSEAGAMDEAAVDARIKAAVAARDELHAATREVEPIVGKRAFDSAGDAYKAALDTLGVDLTGVPPSAYRAMLNLAKSTRSAAPIPAMDSSSSAEALKLIPHLNRL